MTRREIFIYSPLPHPPSFLLRSPIFTPTPIISFLLWFLPSLKFSVFTYSILFFPVQGLSHINIPILTDGKWEPWQLFFFKNIINYTWFIWLHLKKHQKQPNQKISAYTLFTFIKADEEGAFLGCHTFKMKWSTQPGKLMESALTFMFYIAATPFHFPVGKINMPLATTWNLYTSDPKTSEPLHVSLPSACFHSGLPWKLRPVGIAPSQLLLWTGSHAMFKGWQHWGCQCQGIFQSQIFLKGCWPVS